MGKFQKEVDELLKQVGDLKKQLEPNKDQMIEDIQEHISKKDFNFEMGKKGEEVYLRTNMNGYIFGHFLLKQIEEMKNTDTNAYYSYLSGIETALAILKLN